MFGLFSSHAAIKKNAQEIAEFSLYLRHCLSLTLQDFIAAIAVRGIVLDESSQKNAVRDGQLSFNAVNISWTYVNDEKPFIVAGGHGELYGLDIEILSIRNKIMVSVNKPLRVQIGEKKMGKNAHSVYKKILTNPDFFDLQLNLKRRG